MSSTIRYTVVAGPLTLSRMALVVLAAEVGANLVRGLDGIGLLAMGIDGEAGHSLLADSPLSPALAGFFGSAAAVSRRRLRAISLAEEGDRAVLVTRYEHDRLASYLFGADATLGAEVRAIFDEVVAYGPVTGLTTDDFVLDEFGPEEFGARWWSRCELSAAIGAVSEPVGARPPEAVLPTQDVAELHARALIDPAATASALVGAGLSAGQAGALIDDLLSGMPATRVQAWWRHGEVEGYVSLTWLTGGRQGWILDEPEAGDQVLSLRDANLEEIGSLAGERFAAVR